MRLSISTWIYLGLLISFSYGDDPCASEPCLNKGVCTSSDGITHVCKCVKGFLGKRCEIQSKACKDSPCKNGVCHEDAFGDFHCYCSPGYRGKFCEINHDDCLSSPCRNSALCINKVDDYECVCKGTTFGKQCELQLADIETCAKLCPPGSICWRNTSITLNIPWGYGDNICNTQHSCFGGQNITQNHYDYFIDVQLHPVQIQPGDILNFTSDDSISAAINGLMPRLLPVDIYDNSDSFINCNTTNGTLLVSSPQHSIVINSSELLYVGLHYFIMNIDVTYRCDFGLRLNISVKDHSCQNPQSHHSTAMCSNRGQCYTDFNMGEYQCNCCGGFRGKYCEERDYCHATPCENQAICINNDKNKNADNYTCHCQPGYEGKHCSIVTDMCLSHPCINGAICHPRVNSYQCQCQPGYTGRNCETTTDECLSQPCKNNATCTDKIADFSCTCPKGFTGSQCEVNINECESNPCQQHGICIDKINAFQCLCHPGYTGPECGIKNKECTSKLCLNGGVCIDKATDACACGIGYEGKHCENDIDLCNKPEVCNNFQACTDKGSHVDCVCKAGFTGSNCGVNVDDCASQPCSFGGKCQDQENGFICICSPGYEGKLCDQVNETFHDTSRLHLQLITEDCHKLQDPTIMLQFKNEVAASIGASCKCPFTEHNILNQSISLKCHDKISGSLYLHITKAGRYEAEQLICIHQLALKKKENIPTLDNKTFEVGVVYNNERCVQVNRKLGNSDNENDEGGDTIALTVGLVFALVGLFTAAVIVFLKWRKITTPRKKPKSDNKQLVDTINLDLLSAIAPTPKSLYRTSGAAHRNHAFTAHSFDPVDPKSERI